MKQTLETQYALVQGSRGVLLDYCDTLSAAHFVAENPGFGRGGSVRNLLVHSCNTYEYWMAVHALGKKIGFAEYTAFNSVADCRAYFKKIDILMREFLDHFQPSYSVPVARSGTDGKETVATPLEIFTHVITHEYHHKGQILSMTRQLGYLPVNTDIIR